MPTVRRTIETRAPVETAWPYLADFENTRHWDPPTVSTTRESGDGGVGTEYLNVSRILGHEIEIRYQVTECDPPRWLRLRGETTAFTSVDTIEVEPRDGSSLVHYTAAFSLQRVARLAGPLAGPALERMADRTAEQLRDCLDGLEPSGEVPAGVREAVETTRTAEQEGPLADVEGRLARELAQRGITEVDPSWLAQTGLKIRNGSHIDEDQLAGYAG